MKISFHGAARNVTGSCHLLEVNGKRILVDCGMYQGSHELQVDNAADFGFEPSTIDFLLLTHAHLDHCGRIPLLSKRGFAGEIITTSASRELARLVMLDAAHLQEEDARYQNRRAARTHRNHSKPVEPLYTELDTLNSLIHFGRTAKYNEPIKLADDITVTFIDAGHILGSACVHIEVEENHQRRSLLFSGDLGYSGRPILRDPATPPHVDYLIMETTYGDRLHKQLEPSVEEFYAAIEDTFQRGGNVIIPTFAMERAQEILYFLHQGVKSHRLSASLQVFLDSPMAISATEIFKRHHECYNEETAKLFQSNDDPFDLPGLHYTRETAESIALNMIKGGAIIMAGSGMCTGGRVRHHLKQNLWRYESSIVFVGYAAEGTLGRRIVDGARTVKIFGEEMPVNAKVYTINGFSAHADQKELLAWQHKTGKPAKTFLVHGDEEAMLIFAKKLKNTKVEIPHLHQKYKL